MSKDVELIIRAKDAATSAVRNITDSLKELAGIQDDVGQSASKADTLLGKLGQQLSDLKREANQLGSFSKVTSEFDKAGAAVSRLETNIRKSADEFARMARERLVVQQSVDRLRGSLQAEETALRASQQAYKATRAELTQANRLVREAERNQARYNKAIATTPEVKLGSATRSAGAFIAADLNAARQQQARLTADTAKLRNAITQSKSAISELKPEIAAAAQQERKLATETEKAASSIGRQRENLNRARTEFTAIKGAADQASTALGGMSTAQEAVTRAANRTATQLAQTKARIDALTSAQRNVTAPAPDTSKGVQEQRRQLLELRREWTNSQAEVKRLAAAMRETEQPTEQLAQAFGVAQARARLAKEAYQQQQQALHQLTTAARSSFAAFVQSSSQMGAAAQRASAAVRSIGPAAASTAGALNSVASGADNSRRAFAGLHGESRRALSLFQRMRGEVLSLTTSYLGLYAAINNIGGVVNAYRTLEAAQSRLGAVFNQDTGAVRQELSFLERQATRLGISFDVLADQYGKFTVAANAANFSSEATRRIFLSVAEAGRVNKLSIDQMRGVFLALEQMISKGKVTSEELRRQLGDRMPGAFNIMADAIGKSTAELDAMLRKGEVIADQSTLLKFADQLDKRFGPQLATALRTTTTELGRFQNNLFQAQLRIAEGGFIDALSEGLRSLNQYFESREGRDFFLSLGAALGRFVSALAEVPKYFEEIKLAIITFVGFKLGAVFTSLVTSIRQTQGSLSGAARSFFTWNGTVQAAEGYMARFRSATSPTVGVLAALRTQLLGVTAAAGIAGTRFVAMQAGLLALRGTMVAVAGAARLMWVAIGGIPGLVITGITLAATSWLTSVDEATTAIDEHKRVMGEVVSAYEEVKGTTKEWGDELKNVNLIQLERNFRSQVDLMEEALSELRAELARTLSGDFLSGVTFGLFDSDDKRQLDDLVDRYLSGQIAAGDLRDEVAKLNVEFENDEAKKAAGAIFELASKVADAETRVGEAAIAAREFGSASEAIAEAAEKAGGAVADLAGSSKKADEDLQKLFENSEKLNEAFQEMGKLIPDVGDELKRLEAINGLDKQYRDAIKLASTMSQVLGLTEQYNKAFNGIIDSSFSGSSSLVDRIVGAESNGNASAKNPNSSATGLGQFISSTWLRMFKQYFPDRAAGLTDAMILELRKNADISRQMVALYVQENAKILKQAGVAITDANLYLAHFLGAGGAKKVLQAPRGTPVSDLLGEDKISANESVLRGKSVEEVVKWAQRKVGVSQEEIVIERELAEIDNRRAAKAKEYNTDLEARLAAQADEVANAGQLSREGFVQKALASELNRAREAEVVLTDEQIARVKELAGQEWEIRNAKADQKTQTREANAALQQANALSQQRNILQQQFNQAIKTGDLTTAQGLEIRLGEVNGKLAEAIAKARAMWEAIGGPQADAALTKLDNLALKTQTASNRMSFFGLSTEQVGQLAGSFADGFVNVFDTFAQAIASGENAMEALKNAFLQFASDFLRQIAQMILQQLILNALQGLGIPGLGAIGGGVPVRVAHSGTTAIGMTGGQRRTVSPAIFANAVRYHSGGIAGLKPGEIPAILKKGEPVDPGDGSVFNKLFGGGSGGQKTPLTIVNAIDSGDFVSKGMQTIRGQKAIMNFIRDNSDGIRGELGV